MKISFYQTSRRFRGLTLRGALTPLSAFVIALVWVHPAFAQITLGDMFCNVSDQMSNFSDLFGACAYIAGIALLGQGIHMLTRYYDNPNSTPIHQPLTRIAGGGALIATPSVAQTIINTLFTIPGGGGLNVCTPGAVTAGAGLTGLDVLLTNFIGNFKDPMTTFISVVAIAIGIFLIIRGLLKAAKYGVDPRENSMTKIVANLIVGAILMVVGQSFDTLMNTLGFTLGVEQSSVVTNWNVITQLNASAQFITAIQDAGLFFELVGMIAFVRGWMIIKSATEGSGQATLAQGITHVIGGVLAMNIFGFLELMDNTFGTNFLT